MYAKLFKPSSNDDIKQYINDYFDIYVKQNIERLMQVHTCKQIDNNLLVGLKLSDIDYKQFLIETYTEQNVEIRAIYSVLRRLMTGELNQMDELMITLKNANQTITTQYYNEMISTQIKSLLKTFLNIEYTTANQNRGQPLVTQLQDAGLETQAGAGCISMTNI